MNWVHWVRGRVLPGWSVALERGKYCVPYHSTPFAVSPSKLSSCMVFHGKRAEGAVLGIPGYGYVGFHKIMACGIHKV